MFKEILLLVLETHFILLITDGIRTALIMLQVEMFLLTVSTMSFLMVVHFTVNHKNHGMYFDDNRVTISDVESDILPVKLTAALSASSTSPFL